MLYRRKLNLQNKTPTVNKTVVMGNENTLEAAKRYCIKYKCSGITYQYNRYEVRNGNYINYYNDPKLLSWILL